LKETDISDLPTNYTDAALLTMSVRDKFMALPSLERASFQNDPNLWIQDLQKKQIEARAAQKAAQDASNKDAADEAAYRKSRREGSQTAKKVAENSAT